MPTRELMSTRRITSHLGIHSATLRELRRKHLFPDPAARIGRQHYGWEPSVVERYGTDSLEDVYAHLRQRRRPADYDRPDWWDAETVRYLGLPELAEAAMLSQAAIWSHYHNGRLPDPDIRIAHVNGMAGWSPARARQIAEQQGWPIDLARLSDTSGLGEAL